MVEFKKSTAREYFESIVIAVILALFVRTFVLQAFKIPTGSMENNLLIGDHLLVNKFVDAPTATALERALLPAGRIHRGDVLVFKYPVEPDRDYIKRVIGLPGETKESIQRTIDFARELDSETIQVSIAHAYPGTEMYEHLVRGGSLADRPMSDALGHQLPHIEYPGLTREDMMDAVNRFYDSYYFRPRVVWRIVRKALWDAHER